MIEKLKSWYSINRDTLDHRDRIFLNNPVIMQGMGLVPIVAVATTLQNAFVMALAVLLMLTPTRIAAALLSRNTHFRFRAVAYSMTAAITYTLASFLIIDVLHLPVQSIGLYLPLLVCEPLIIKRYARSGTEKVRSAIIKGLLTTCGFLLVLFPVAAVRELLGAGTLLGKQIIPRGGALPFVGLIGGGFILMGVVLALWRNLVRIFRDSAKNG